MSQRVFVRNLGGTPIVIDAAIVETPVTDNAVPRFDGTDGTMQDSTVYIDDDGHVGIGIPPLATTGILYFDTVTGGGDVAGFQFVPHFTPVTGSPYYGFASVPSIEAGSATITNVINIRVEPWNNLGGNTITNAYGLWVDAQTIGSTINRSIYVSGGISEFDGQLIAKGTATNDNAATGDIGEYVSSTVASGSAVALSTGTAADITSISLTAGDWDVWGNVSYVVNAATTTTFMTAYIHDVSATTVTAPNNGALTSSTVPTAAGQGRTMSAGQKRFSLSTTTTVFLETVVGFAVNTISAFGFIGARRVR